MGPGTISFSFDCDCRYESRILVLGQTIDERGVYEVTGDAIAFGRESGQITTWPYQLEGDRLLLTEHPTETHVYRRVSATTCQPPPR